MDEERPTTPEPIRKGYSQGDVRRALWHVVVAWIFGAPFFSIVSGAAFTSFLTTYLKADDFTYGLIMAASPAAMIFLFAGSYVAERTGLAKRSFLIYCTTHRLIWLAVAPQARRLTHGAPPPPHAPGGAIAFTSQAMANYGGAGWAAWISGIVPQDVAGKFFGRRSQLGMISTVTISTAVVFLVQHHKGEGWAYALVFSVAALLGAADILLFLPVREIPRRSESSPPTIKEILTTPWHNRLFRSFALYNGVAWMAYMMMGSFLWRYCYDSPAANGLGLSVLQTHILLFILPVGAMALTAPLWGQAIDRFGPKPVLSLSALTAVVLPTVWLFAHPGWEWILWVAIFAAGLTWPGIEQVNFYMIVKGFPDERRTTYTSAFQVVLGLATTVGIALGGVCASFWQTHLHQIPGLPAWVSHYQPVFLTTILLRAAAFVYLVRCVPLPGGVAHRALARALAADATRALPGGRAALRWRRRRKG